MKRNLSLSAVVSVIFFNVSGGPYALEGALAAGHGLALLLIAAAPVVWSAPVALVCAELGSALPEEGGYYAWAKRACGQFGAFCQGSWAWLFTVVNMGIYPTMFCDYLAYFLPETGEDGQQWLRKGMMLAMIWSFVLLNLGGARTVGNMSKFFMLMVLTPFVIMVFVGISRGLAEGFPRNAFTPLIAHGSTFPSAVAVATPVVLWNFLGWDSISTIAGEMQNARRDYPRALLIAVLLITAVYLIPTVVAQLFVDEETVVWKTGAWGLVAGQIAGTWLGQFTSAMGMVAAAGLYSGLVLVYSRVPFVMGSDRFLPQVLMKCNSRDAPWVSLVASGIVYSAVVLLFKNLEELAACAVTLYTGVVALEVVSFLVLRWREPELERPFKVGGGWPVAGLVCALPLVCLAAAAYYYVQEFGLWIVVGKPLVLMALVPLLFPVAVWHRNKSLPRESLQTETPP